MRQCAALFHRFEATLEAQHQQRRTATEAAT